MKKIFVIFLLMITDSGFAKSESSKFKFMLNKESLQKAVFVGIGSVKKIDNKEHFIIETNWKGVERKIEILPVFTDPSEIGGITYHELESEKKYIMVFGRSVKNPIPLDSCFTYVTAMQSKLEFEEKIKFIQNVLGKPKYIQK